ncbi:hypothetical protein PoB_001547000 [Plakobranchus ocellatus]|uniref:Uncharacterized protein n=1 Tax=Plakobranchus ocellatus TaxID=259542 RepID=A0AAV3Z1B5_9GAST|nr:hypothetical protein PoB_001547000 [Plakobranchus ocellatus]
MPRLPGNLGSVTAGAHALVAMEIHCSGSPVTSRTRMGCFSALGVTGGMGYCVEPVHNKLISGFKALRQAGAPVAGLEPAIEGSQQISGRIQKPMCHRNWWRERRI